MKKRTVVALAVIAVLGMSALWLLRSYQLQIVHSIVVNAVVQKAPEDFPAQRIRAAFERALGSAALQDEQEAYLERLLELSRRLEKVQRLSASELDGILGELADRWPDRPSGSEAGRAKRAAEAMLPWHREVSPLSDRNQTGTLSRLRAYDSAPACENPGAVGEAEAGTHPLFDLHEPTAGLGSHSGGLAFGAPKEASKTRRQPENQPEER